MEPMPATLGRGVGEEEHQAGEELHLPEAQAAGQPHEPDAEGWQGEQQEQLDRVQGEDLDAAALVGQQVTALGAKGVQLLQPRFPAGLPLFDWGRQPSAQRASRWMRGETQSSTSPR